MQEYKLYKDAAAKAQLPPAIDFVAPAGEQKGPAPAQGAT